MMKLQKKMEEEQELQIHISQEDWDTLITKEEEEEQFEEVKRKKKVRKEEEEENNEITLKFIRLNNLAGEPTRATPGSIGYDVYAAHDCFLPPNGKRYKINLGLMWVFPKGYYGQYHSRSGMAVKDGIVVIPEGAIINPDFPQEASVHLVNYPAENKFGGKQIFHGDKIAQLVLYKKITLHIQETREQFPNKTSWKGRYRSTGC